MAIKDLEQARIVARLYDDLKQATIYAKQWADTVVNIEKQLGVMPEYLNNVSPDESEFIDSAKNISDTFAKAIPVSPDVLKPLQPIVTEPPQNTNVNLDVKP